MEVEAKTIDPIIMFKYDGAGNNNSVGQLRPSFAKKIGKVKLEMSPSVQTNEAVENPRVPSYGFKSNATFNKATTESMQSSARSPFKVQACQANARTPSNQSESDIYNISQKLNETARPQKRKPIENIGSAGKLNLTTVEGFSSTHKMINVQNKGEGMFSEVMTEMTNGADDQLGKAIGLGDSNGEQPRAIEMVVDEHKYHLNEESQMSRRRPTEMKHREQA